MCCEPVLLPTGFRQGGGAASWRVGVRGAADGVRPPVLLRSVAGGFRPSSDDTAGNAC